MRNKILGITGVAGLGTTLGAISGGILGALGGLGVTVLFFIFTILPWANDQVQNAPEWYWVAVVMGLVPTAVVLIIALILGVIIGALIFGLIALVMTGGLAAVVAQAKKS